MASSLFMPCMRIALASLLLSAGVIFGPATAQVQAFDGKTRDYLPKGSVNASALIGPPPNLDSNELREQMAVVLWLQHTRTPAQVAFASKSLNLERFAPILSLELVNADGIELKDTLDAVISEVRSDYDALKGKYDLPRPFQINEAVKPVGDARPVAAYPSGHAIRATVYASLLSEIFPDQSEALQVLANQIAYGRVVAGVHFPIDITAGQKLGHAFAAVIVKQAAFKKAVERILGKQHSRSR